MFNQFYNKSLRKLVVGFGSLFNNIYVSHANPDNINSPLDIRVPITYAPQEKFIRRLLEPSSINDATRIENQLPRLSYIMTNVSPDPTRRRSKFVSISSPDVVNNECQDTGQSINDVIPINVGFNLFVYTRHIDDTLQIIEQILPYFNPDHIVEIDLNDVQTNVRIPITLASNNINERYDGDFGNRRINISSLSFVAKSYIYGQIQSVTTINNVDTNITID
jgi:hypothetical protein